MTSVWDHRFEESGRPLVIAHRGASALAPENTVTAFELAQSLKADGVETDIRMTADGVPVCFHDQTLARLARDPRPVGAMRLDELWTLLPTLPTLTEALRVCARCGLLLDIKLASDQPIAIVGEAVLAAQALERTLIGVRHATHAAALFQLNPRFRLLAIDADPNRAEQWGAAGASWFRLWQSDMTAERAAAVRQAGLRLAVMSGGGLPHGGAIAPESWAAVLALGPDAILLDDPRSLG